MLELSGFLTFPNLVNTKWHLIVVLKLDFLWLLTRLDIFSWSTLVYSFMKCLFVSLVHYVLKIVYSEYLCFMYFLNFKIITHMEKLHIQYRGNFFHWKFRLMPLYPWINKCMFPATKQGRCPINYNKTIEITDHFYQLILRSHSGFQVISIMFIIAKEFSLESPFHFTYYIFSVSFSLPQFFSLCLTFKILALLKAIKASHFVEYLFL